jgi:hypothetical protein
MTRVLVGVLLFGVVTFAAPDPAGAGLPLTQSRPYEVVCELQGGTFSVAIDDRSLYCDKEGELLTAFTPRQLAVQRFFCTKLYGAFFGVQGFVRPDGTTGTGTFCSTA